MKLLATDGPKTRHYWLAGFFLLIGVIGFIDYLTGYELAFSPFYLFPISAISWLSGKRAGIIAACISALTWLVADILTRHIYSHPSLYFINTALRLFNFLTVSFLVASLRKEMDLEIRLARNDVITELANARSFLEFLDREVAHAARFHEAITVMYIDLDNFKMINDQYGHAAGNQVLRDVATVLRDSLRKNDFVARIGGDEFAAVLPETGKEIAPVVSRRIMSRLEAGMLEHNWPITFSIGVVTAEQAAEISAESLLQQADELMYQVKKDGKNNLRFAVYKQ